MVKWNNDRFSAGIIVRSSSNKGVCLLYCPSAQRDLFVAVSAIISTKHDSYRVQYRNRLVVIMTAECACFKLDISGTQISAAISLRTPLCNNETTKYILVSQFVSVIFFIGGWSIKFSCFIYYYSLFFFWQGHAKTVANRNLNI